MNSFLAPNHHCIRSTLQSYDSIFQNVVHQNHPGDLLQIQIPGPDVWRSLWILNKYPNSAYYFFFFLEIGVYLFIYLFLAVLGLRFCARAFSSCGKRGPLFIAVRGPLTIAASLVAEHRLQTRRLSSCGSRAQLLRGMWDLPRPGLEPMSPALAGRLSTTAPPGKPNPAYFYQHLIFVNT